jgi:ComEC/Rec2-related protein
MTNIQCHFGKNQGQLKINNFSPEFTFLFFGIFYIFWIFINNLTEDINLSLFVLLAIVIFFLWLFFYLKKYLLVFLFSVLWFTIWIYVSDFNLEKINENLAIINEYTDKVEITAEIKSISKITDERITYIWEIGSFLNLTQSSPYKGEGKNNNLFLEKERLKEILIEISINWNQKLEKWTIIKFEAEINRYEPFNNFEYEKYMLSKWIYFRVYPYNYEIIWENKVNIIIKDISSFRENLLTKIKEIYRKEEAAFLGWILVWARENLPANLSTNFNNSGLTHIIAVSGFNITILIVFFGYIIKFLPPYIRFTFISIIIILFTILVWFNAPVVRASIMWIIWYFVLVSWRKWDTLAIIILTLLVMASFSPLSINYDVSLHLSFLAVLWIVYIQPFLERKLKFIPDIFEIRTALSLTLSALIFTFPIMIINFWQISLIAPISNILVSWTIPIIMLIWFLSLIFYSVLPILWIIIGCFARLLLKWDILVVNTLWEFKYSVIKYDFWEYRGYYEVIYFMILVFVIMRFRKPKQA